ncbi:DUF1653 domain-containing protein [Acinetobacter rudis]|uniref:DUF1653 domain-containing protein n=1 Tax=Acinetobacter rudis TaxID=632955 RepID=A0AAW8JAU2_9GAMM|nr:DUF1653 domain-containing protein [Acinetobacter rudis]MDQ8934794.1 DUF1653 domain-containing protein [Acinetobacter rudis]MDQ8951459.1 DUF1653 domain-containing protein [Acinetobacter rudis]MDQ9017125.1 DUF1653 domain-containing protein [Acinetobacter rudis]
MPDTQLKSGIYRHYKGQLYQVFSVARHSETQEFFVVYQCLYGDYSIWIRPLTMFTEMVVLEDGRSVARFQLEQQH